MILVFGKTGQVARELQFFREVLTLDRSEANLLNPMSCYNSIYKYRPDFVINAAAYTDVEKSEFEKDIAMRVNAKAPEEMAKACMELEIPIIHLSTDYVFKGTGKNKWKTDDFTCPQNIYGQSKLLGEKAIVKSGAIYIILRCSWIISAHGKNFVKTMLSLSKKNKTIHIVNDQIGGPTPAKDIANACIVISEQLKNNKNKSGIYHFSGTPDVSWYEFANNIFKQAGLNTTAIPILSNKYSTKVKRPTNSRLDCSDTEVVFKIKQPYWKIGVKEILIDLENYNETT